MVSFVFVVQSSHIMMCVACVMAFFVKPLFICGVLSMAIWFYSFFGQKMLWSLI